MNRNTYFMFRWEDRGLDIISFKRFSEELRNLGITVTTIENFTTFQGKGVAGYATSPIFSSEFIESYSKLVEYACNDKTIEYLLNIYNLYTTDFLCCVSCKDLRRIMQEIKEARGKYLSVHVTVVYALDSESGDTTILNLLLSYLGVPNRIRPM